MHIGKSARFFVLSLAAMLCIAAPALALENVVLQLKWEHEYQFAGYYAAKWQGFYEREGLDVEIRSAATPEGKLLDPIGEVLAGRAQFGVGSLDILVGRGKGEDLIALAPIFQRSPLAVHALSGTVLKKPADLLKLRVATFESEYGIVEVRAMLRASKLEPAALNIVHEPPTVDSLVSGKADAIVTYGVSAQARARELGVSLHSLEPADFGVQTYGDTLFTSGDLVHQRPDLVERFVRASLEGWRYALDNKQEVADRISATLPRYIYTFGDLQTYNREFAARMDRYTYFPGVNPGTSDRNRWSRSYRLLLDAGLIEHPYAIEDLLSASATGSGAARSPTMLDLVLLGAIVLLMFAVMVWWRFRFRHASFVLIALLAMAELLVEWRYREEQAQNVRLDVIEQLSAVRARIEGVINNNLSLTNGLAAFVAANPELDDAEFEAYAKAIIAREPTLINLAAAPDLVVRHVYPRKGNEAVIGLDYRKNKAQREAAERVLQTGEMIVAGPVNLVQGGEAFIGRVPVYVDDANGVRHIWGLVSAPISVDGALQSAGIATALQNLRIAIRGRDGTGEQGDVFYGDPATFDLPDVVSMPILVGGGSWQIGATAIAGAATPFGLWVIRLAFAALLVLTIAALRSRMLQHRKEREYASVINRQANEDALTGLPNRASFREKLSSAIARSARSGASHALLFIDLDDFKSVNDNLGHDAGDQLLIEAAQRIRDCVRGSDTVARLGGDEFTAILYDVTAQDAIGQVAEKIVLSMRRAFRVGEREVFCAASVGLAVYPSDADDPDTLIIKADQAMYSVKQSGRNGWHFYTQEMHERSERRHRLFNELSVALDNDQLQAYLQPIICLRSGEITACEALARWQRNDGVWVSPAEFVEVAEQRGLINRLDYFVLQTSINALNCINSKHGTSIGLSANVSPGIFFSKNQDLQRWMGLVRETARELRLSIEITERLLVGESDEAHRALKELSAAQVSISIDDFGTGYSSLGYLMRFPVDTIKIDRSFTRGIGLDKAHETLIDTIIGMARRLGKKVVAEGVETEAQCDYLRELGCDFAQGYLFGKPMSAADFGEFVRASAPTHDTPR
ncbi:MAG: EAL domain-containing protein [Gammaproteobacteria bacterium]|nr:EAL domain-containing protein [Gammaproteobacteria bacterium]